MIPFDWTPENTAQALSMWAAGHSASEVGREIGTTRASVIGKVHRMGEGSRLRTHGYKPGLSWSDEDRGRLRVLASDHTLRAGEMNAFHFAVGRQDDADTLVKAHHYSRRPPGNVQVVGTWHEDGGLFGDRGAAVAACYFSIPPTRWSEDVLELSRLVRSPQMTAPLSRLVSLTVKHVAWAKHGNLLISFADRTQGHHGGIYQSCSWAYAGCRDRRQDGLLVDGTFIPGRSCNSRWGTRSPTKLAAMLRGHTVEPHYDEGKHLYWRALNRDGQKKAQRLGLEAMAYCKPSST